MDSKSSAWTRARPTLLVIAVLVMFAGALRLPGLVTEFWLDEIYSWHVATYEMQSWQQVFTKGAVDNSHPLNTLFMYVVGNQRHWEIYRIPALIAGLGSICLAARIALRRGRRHALAAAMVFGFSYPLIVYSTEARGYGLLILAMLGAIDAADRFLADAAGWWPPLELAIASVLGMLSHPTFAVGYAAVAAWTVMNLRRHGPSIGASVRSVTLLHAIPLLVVFVCYVGFYRRIIVGGADPTTVPSLVADTLALTFGTSSGIVGSTSLWAACLAALAGVWTLLSIWRAWPEILPLGILGMLVLPGAILVAKVSSGAVFFYPRYFLASMTIALLLFSLAIGHAWSGSAHSTFRGTILMAVFLGCNLFHTYKFSLIGRGHCLDALRYVIENDQSRRITIGGDQDFRVLEPLLFFGQFLPEQLEIRYVLTKETDHQTPDWYIISSGVGPTPQIILLSGAHFVLRRSFTFYGPSGTRWAVYHHET